MRKIISAIALLLFPLVSFATIFTPSTGDQSIQFLSNIFGPVPYLSLMTTGPTLLSSMFATFNAVILTVGFIIITYTIGKSTMTTAHEGEVMGRQQSSIWIPLRMTIGIGTLIPLGSAGYNLLQVILMYVILQGVGVADNVWNAALNAMQQGNLAVQPVSSVQTATVASNVFMGLVCTESLPAPYNKVQFGSKGILFGGPSSGLLSSAGACGTVLYPTLSTTSEQQAASISKATGTNVVGLIDNVYDTQKAQLKTLVENLTPVAKLFASDQTPSESDAVSTAAAAYYANVNKAIVNAVGQMQLQKGFIPSTMKDQGWINAGSYYLRIANMNNYVSSTFGDMPDATSMSARRINNLGLTSAQNTTLQSNYNAALNYVGNDLSSHGVTGNTYFAQQATVPDNITFPFNAILAPIYSGFNSFFSSWYDLVGSGISNTQNPVMDIQGFGLTMVKTVGYVWIALIAAAALVFVGIAALGAATSWIPFAGSSAATAAATTSVAVSTVVGWISALVNPILLSLFVLGATMAYYVPLIPFILFTMGGIAWLIAVIETMIAAPIVALGIVHPEGHDVWGKAEPAVMMTANVFLRPTFMVFGLVAGMLLSYVALTFVNVGFANVASFATGGQMPLLGEVAMVMLYTIFVVIVVQKSFSLIHEIPNRIMRWLGHQDQLGGGEEQALQEAKGGFTEQTRAGGQALQSGGGAVSQDLAGGTKAGADALRAPTKGGEVAPGGGGGGGGGDVGIGGDGGDAPPTPPPGVG